MQSSRFGDPGSPATRMRRSMWPSAWSTSITTGARSRPQVPTSVTTSRRLCPASASGRVRGPFFASTTGVAGRATFSGTQPTGVLAGSWDLPPTSSWKARLDERLGVSVGGRHHVRADLERLPLVVIDVWSRRVVGWSMVTHLRSELVLQALNMVSSRYPSTETGQLHSYNSVRSWR